MNNYILVEADYGRKSVWVVCDYVKLTEEELESLSQALWKYKYEINVDLWVRGFRKNKQWEFTIGDTNILDRISKKLVEIIKELFPNKSVEFSKENKYE